MKILIIRFSSIGDIVLTTPIVRCLKNQIQGAEIHYLTKEQFRPLLESNPYIDRLICIQKDKDVKGVMQELRGEQYDFIVDLHKNIRSWKVILSLWKPFGTFTKLNIRKWLLCRLHINLLPDIHIVDRYFSAVKKLKVTNDGKGLDYFIPDGTDPWQKIPGLPPKGYTALVIGGKHTTKQLPKERLLELCRLLGGEVVLLGGLEDQEVGSYLEISLKSEVGSTQYAVRSTQYPVPSTQQQPLLRTAYCVLFNTCGLLTMNESAMVLKQADRVITHDTGLMHIAAALKKDVVSIWGNTVPEFGMYPYYPANSQSTSTILEVKGLNCRPCSKIGYDKCPKGHFRCMVEVDFKGLVKGDE